MFRIFAFFVLLLALTNNVFSQGEEANKLAFEKDKRDSLAEWIQSNNNKLSLEKSTRIVDVVNYNASQLQLDPLFILSMIKAESSYKPSATSYVGARGLMQVMPRWHHDKLKGRNPYAIDVNIEVGTKIWDACLDKTNGNVYKALSCYSGGASKRYSKKIAKTHKELNEQVRVLALLNDNDEHVVYKFDTPRVAKRKSKDVLLAFAQQKAI